ncbi:MAG TPA: hypothetical protein VGJ53_17540 [Micromonosporaceae bacterium]|jgi:hypothetical protein
MATVRLVLCALAALLIGGCAGADRDATPAARAKTATTYGPDVVHPGGVQNVQFGDTMAQLEQRGEIVRDPGGCGPRLAGVPNASPVFANGRLVLVWAYLPLHTPEGIAVGSPVPTVRAAYPHLLPLTAPAGTYRFDGLMMVTGDRAYLFLHDGHTVQKLVVGYRAYAQRLFDDGFGTC